mmetsp:Transcript_118993/g.210357  ORF Transcript_118993/g.210357 Transcript_118993/m.210357 type:complete len:238 (-) Transcript_118993:500-1213(-)
MSSKRLSASSSKIPRSRSLKPKVGVRMSSWNSWKSSSPLWSASSSKKSCAIDLRSSFSVFSKTPPTTSRFSFAIVSVRSTITAMITLRTPKVQMMIVIKQSQTVIGLTSLMGLTMSVAQLSKVISWSTVHIDLYTVPTYMSDCRQCSFTYSLWPTAVQSTTATQYTMMKSRSATQPIVVIESSRPWMIIHSSRNIRMPLMFRTIRSSRSKRMMRTAGIEPSSEIDTVRSTQLRTTST